MNTHKNNDLSNNVLLNISDNGVATVTLNNPDKHNAFDDTVIAELTTTFTAVAQNQSVRVMVLASNGKSFSAGADLAWMKRMASYSFSENLVDANALAVMLKTLNFMPMPTIAKIQGAAFGGAVGLVSCCDIAIASDKASFCLSEVKLGLIPATISPYVIKAMGEKACRRYFLTAERFFAKKAEQLGLVDEICDVDELDLCVEQMINTLLNNSPAAVKQAKKLVFEVSNRIIDDALLKDTGERIAAIRVSAEGQEGLSAFFEKRPANWISSNNSASTDEAK